LGRKKQGSYLYLDHPLENAGAEAPRRRVFPFPTWCSRVLVSILGLILGDRRARYSPIAPEFIYRGCHRERWRYAARRQPPRPRSHKVFQIEATVVLSDLFLVGCTGSDPPPDSLVFTKDLRVGFPEPFPAP
jgi:hypothetical protein